jgi:hypothetical protein
MSVKNVLFQGGDGTAIPAGMVGEKINWAVSSGITISGANTNIGNGSTTGVITLTPGFYLSSCFGELFASDSSVYCPTELYVISGSATITNGSPLRGALMGDDGSAQWQNYSRVAYINVTSTALITVRNSALAGGTCSSCSLVGGFAVRIA